MKEYDEIYWIDMVEEWINSAYDEDGNTVLCDRCDEEIKWNSLDQLWYCDGCGQIIDRPTFFNHIGAHRIPGTLCLTNCRENYPFCKKICKQYTIDPFDPMMD